MCVCLHVFVWVWLCACIDMSTDGTADCKFTTLSMCVVVVIVNVVGGKGAKWRGIGAGSAAGRDSGQRLRCVAFACHFLV